MNTPLSRPAFLLAALVAALLAPSLHAQDTFGQLVIRKPVASVSVTQGTAETAIKINKTFALSGVTGQVVRFNTIEGNMDVAMLPDDAPLNVANFLSYVNNGAYNSSFFHRSTAEATSGLSIIQGGLATITADGTDVTTIPAGATVVNEYKVANTHGTLAAAKLGGDPNSASSQWFFNGGDNSSVLGADNNGGFTVFGRVIGNSGLSVLDALQAIPVPTTDGKEGDGPLASPYNEVPLIGYTGTEQTSSDYIKELVKINSVAVVPLLAQTGVPGLVTIKVKNSNPNLVTASIVGKKLHLVYNPEASGTAKIVLKAKGPANNLKAVFTVTVAGR